MNNNNELYNQMLAEIDAINKRADDRVDSLKTMFEELNSLIDDVLAEGVVCG